MPASRGASERTVARSLVRFGNRGSDSRCKVTDVFDAGETFGLMCQVEVGESEPSLLVTPITELSFDRRHPIARDVADYRRRRAQMA